MRAERRNDSIAFSDTHILSDRLVNEARIGVFDQRNQNLGENRATDYVSQFGIPGLTIPTDLQGWPAVRIDGYSEFGDRPNDPFIYDIQNIQFFNMTTWMRGRHNLKFGVDTIRSNYVESDVRNVRGDFQHSDGSANAYGGSGPSLTGGVDWRSGALAYGVFGGYGRQSIDWGRGAGDFRQSDTTLGGFVGWNGAHGWIAGQLSYTNLDFDTHRDIVLGATTRTHDGSPGGSFFAPPRL